jgi:hypothetical protein
VSAYWDALILGHETAGIGLEPELAEAIERFHHLAATSPAGARARVWGRLQPVLSGEVGIPRPPVLSDAPPEATGTITTPNGHHAALVPRLKRHTTRQIGRWALTHLATAALLVLTLTAGLAAIWAGSAPRDDAGNHRPGLVRAAEVAPGRVIDELLFEATFTPEALTVGGIETIYYRVTLPPGISLPYLAGPSCVRRVDVVTAGVGVELIQSGTYALQLDTPFEVRRGGAASEVEKVPAGAEVVLAPGDVATYPDYTGQGTIRSAGDEPVVIVGVAMVSIEGLGVPAPRLPIGVKAEQLTHSVDTDWWSQPGQPLAVNLWRLELPEGASVGPYEGTGLEALLVERGVISRGFLRAGENAPNHIPLLYRAGRSTSFMGPTPGVRRVVANVADEPAVLLALSIEPTGITSATLAS